MNTETGMRRKIGLLLLIAIGFILIEHFVYTHIAGYRIPIMDFYRWIANYGERIHSGSMRFVDFFSDTNEQVQPLALAIDFFVFEHTNYSMYALVIIGAIFKAMLAVGLAAWLYRRCDWTRTPDLLFAAAVLLAVVMAELNGNQWELTIEPFGLTCAIRVIVMFGIFVLASKFIRRMLSLSFRQQVLYILVLGALSGAFSLLLAGGYCVGFLGAISVAFLIECAISWKQMKPRHMILAIMWAAAVLGSVAVYISFAGEGTTDVLQSNTSVVTYLKGFLVYLGGAIVPQHYAEVTVKHFIIGGLAVFVAAMATGVVYLKLKLGKRSYMPLLLMLYAAICGAVIVVSRVPMYGPGTMASSRYSVESIVGLIGMLWAWLLIYPEINKNAIVKAVLWVGLIGILLLNLHCMYDEFHWGFARRRYQDNLRAVIVEYKKHTDEDLTSSQAEPRHVRDACAFLEKYGFTPFGE